MGHQGRMLHALDTCDSEVCGEGFQLSSGIPPFCAEPVCTRDECCVALGQCESSVCGAGFKLSSGIPPFCAGVACTREECCVEDVQYTTTTTTYYRRSR